ncbi:MAG: T9SS type A sorting domain-containing protein [Ignavibacterium album]|nr:T9SS type A sorting domain-containing protein [Ignavibacterium album]
MLAHSDPIDISENLMLDYLEIIEYTKLARIAWALYYYFDDPTIYNFIWLARNVSAYAIFVNIDERWNNSVVEATQSDGLVSKFSQQYPNANSLYFPDDASHMEQLDNNQVVDALRSALNQYGNGPLVAPVIASITQNPVPIYKGTGGYVYANLSQGNGTINYNWFSTNQPSYVSINPNGSSCQITYLNVVESIPGDAPTWDFGCTVTNPAFPGWSSTMRFSPSLNSDPNGCPTLAFDNRGTLISENPLLITSMSNPGKDVTDYYLINTPLAPVNNKINVTIHEPQTEHTWFDNFSLLETRANPDETIVVNDEGQVINYKGVLPARILLNGETDITSNLLELDSLSVELNPGDKLTISRNAVEGDGDVVLGGEEPIIVKDRPSLIMNILTESKVEDSEEIKTESIPITNFFLRPNKSIISKRLRNLPTGTIEITVNKRLTLDYFVFVSDLRTARTRELPLVSAVHNVNGDVKTKLTGIDQNYSEMYPTERIDLSFSTTINSGNRAYILKTVGRYETDTTFLAKQNNLAKLNEQPIIPTENKLYDNYPNPFNPSTIIKYSLKDGGRVSLKIFNSLGEEVRTLVNETEAAGIYEVEFNASNLPSGVYIYQLTTPGFTQARKMILAK